MPESRPPAAAVRSTALPFVCWLNERSRKRPCRSRCTALRRPPKLSRTRPSITILNVVLETLIQTYGYPVVLIGAFLEGETVLVMGGFAAYRGYLNLPLVILCAFVGTFCSDQLFFHFGHWKGRQLFSGRPTWERRAERVQALLARYQLLVILGFRFVYGIRNITPFVIGASGFRPARFLVLNFLGAILWATTVGSAGYVFGRVLELVIRDLKKYEIIVLLGVGVFGTAAWLWHVARSRMSKNSRNMRVSEMAGGTIPPP